MACLLCTKFIVILQTLLISAYAAIMTCKGKLLAPKDDTNTTESPDTEGEGADASDADEIEQLLRTDAVVSS